jgi:hypothetical protein
MTTVSDAGREQSSCLSTRLILLLLPLLLFAAPACAEDVVELWRSASFAYAVAVSVNAMDDSCWVADLGSAQLVHLAEDGTQLWRGEGFSDPRGVSVVATAGSCWVATNDGFNGRFVHLGADGRLLREVPVVGNAVAVSANAVDGSAWAAVNVYPELNSHVIYLAADGTELARADFEEPVESLSVNPRDGSCWVGLGTAAAPPVAHLSATGDVLWRGESGLGSGDVSVDPADGSCWVAQTTGSAVHLAPDGTEVWRGPGVPPLSVNPADGSCWMGAATEGPGVCHLAKDGTELWQEQGTGPCGLSANGYDGSCWAADLVDGQVVHFAVVGYQGPAFRDIAAWFWAYDEIGVCSDANIVQGYTDGTYQPTLPVTRDQMAVYVSRALVSPSGDAAIPDPEPPPSFSDVSTDHWAYKHIEYAVSQSVVRGYDDGTYKPDLVVDRGQMAVYIARAMVTPSGDAGIPDPVLPATFPDVSDAFWAYKHIEYCVEHGVVQGYEDGLYHPEWVVTRDQMAVYIARAFELPM